MPLSMAKAPPFTAAVLFTNLVPSKDISVRGEATRFRLRLGVLAQAQCMVTLIASSPIGLGLGLGSGPGLGWRGGQSAQL